MEKAKKLLNINLPIQIGFFILQYAKLRMLQFYYDFLDAYVDRKNFAYCEMDTDSANMALSGPDVIKSHLRETYDRALTGCCRDGVDPEWFPRSCCQRHAKYDKRTPGLFKVEYESDVMIGLCSKTYIVQKARTEPVSSTAMTACKLLRRAKGLPRKRLDNLPRKVKEVKFSSKGVTKHRVKAPMSIFRHVRKTHRAGPGFLKGFRARHNGISTYEQRRNGYSYFYCKRRVLNDGVSTVPLNIELCPIKKEEEIDREDFMEEEHTPMEIDSEETPLQLDDADRYFVSLLEMNFESDDDMS